MTIVTLPTPILIVLGGFLVDSSVPYDQVRMVSPLVLPSILIHKPLEKGNGYIEFLILCILLSSPSFIFKPMHSCVVLYYPSTFRPSLSRVIVQDCYNSSSQLMCGLCTCTS